MADGRRVRRRRTTAFTIVLAMLAATLVAAVAPEPASATPNEISTVAGSATAGYTGDCEPVRFDDPGGIAFDADGNLFVADPGNHRVRRISIDGSVITVAGIGDLGLSGDGGPATDAELYTPNDVAVDSAGNLYIADSTNNRIRKVDSSGTITTVAGTGSGGNPGFSGDGGPATAAELASPTGIDFDSAGNLYIADRANNRIRKVDTSGTITTVAGTGTAGYSGDGGPATSAQLNSPFRVAVDASDDVVVADANNWRVRRVDTSTGTITTIAGTGAIGYSGDGGPATSAQLRTVEGLAAAGDGTLYLSDSNNWRVRAIDPTGTITTYAGTGLLGNGNDDVPATSSALHGPAGLALSPTGELHISDQGNNRIRRVDGDGKIQAVAGDADNGTAGFGDCATATTAQLDTPVAVAADSKVVQNVYIADWANHVVRKFDTGSGTITTVAGTGTAGYSGDGGPATSAQLNHPTDLEVDGSDVFVVDGDNHVVRRIDTTSGVITTIAGTGTAGYSGDGGPATSAQLNLPYGITRDVSDNLYISERGSGVVRKIDTGGVITTIAGTGTEGFSGDGGPATSAQLDEPLGIELDVVAAEPTGLETVVYIADSANHRVRRIAGDGTISTYAGNGGAGYSGDGGPADTTSLYSPADVVANDVGDVFVADAFNHRIRRIDIEDGAITTVAGVGTAGFSGDGGVAIDAELSGPSGLTLAADDDLFVADTGNHRIRRIEAGTAVGYLRATTSPALPAEILVDGVSRDSWGLNWVELPVGDHEVCFQQVAGYTEPDCQDVAIEPDQTTEIVGTYAERGWLRVVTDPALPASIRVDGMQRNDWGLWIDVPPGDYEVCYGKVEGWDSPPCETATVTAGNTTTMTGTFTENPAATGPSVSFGTLRVITDPPVASRISIDGTPRDVWGLNWLKLLPGDYELCFGDVPAMSTPDCQDITVSEDSTTTRAGSFGEKGYLQVTTDPPTGSTISVDGIPMNAWGMWNPITSGDHEVCFGDVEGLVTPPCETATVTRGDTTTVTGTFTSP